jgi:hypothetical protein
MNIRVSSLSALLIATASFLFATSAHATVVDLTQPDSSGEINGALFYSTDQQPAGTGFIDPFLRVQANGNTGFEQGYNTDAAYPFDDKNPHNFQHSLLLSSLSQFDINGTEYFKFMLDSNEPGGNKNQGHWFNLTALQIYTSNNGSPTTTTFNPDGTLNLGTLAYNIAPSSVINTATGSGKYDMVMYVPVSLFNLSDKYVILYFAGVGNGGFEEWTAATGINPIPEASTFFPIIGLLAAVFSTQFVRRRQLQQLSK